MVSQIYFSEEETKIGSLVWWNRWLAKKGFAKRRSFSFFSFPSSFSFLLLITTIQNSDDTANKTKQTLSGPIQYYFYFQLCKSFGRPNKHFVGRPLSANHISSQQILLLLLQLGNPISNWWPSIWVCGKFCLLSSSSSDKSRNEEGRKEERKKERKKVISFLLKTQTIVTRNRNKLTQKVYHFKLNASHVLFWCLCWNVVFDYLCASFFSLFEQTLCLIDAILNKTTFEHTKLESQKQQTNKHLPSAKVSI